MTDIQQLKRLPIRDYLSRRGIQPAKENNRCGFYLSPFRAEHTPSFKVDYAQNLWYDFGTGEGGSIIDLVMRMENCDFMQAVQSLDNGEIKPTASAIPVPAMLTAPALRILSDAPLRHPALVGYLQSRGIDAAVLNSVVNLPKAIPFLQQHRAVHTFFDNDEAGRRATAQVQQLAPAVEAVDQSPLYRHCNDLNEYLQARQTTVQQADRKDRNNGNRIESKAPASAHRSSRERQTQSAG